MKTILKTIAYKTLTTIELAAIAYFLTGSVEAAASTGLIHAGVSACTYAAFDSVWNAYVG